MSTYAGATETTIYVGGMLEKLTTSVRVHWKHRIPTPSGEVQVIRRSDGTHEVLYATTDHLGSTDALMDAAGGVLVRESFGAWGARRGSNWSSSTAPDWAGIANSTRRGYTGHEQLDNIMLVHMNGRVYDPAIGRFLSADPYVKGIDASQGWNRYAYVSNRPLAFTDPSGYESFSRGDSLHGHVVAILPGLDPAADPEMEEIITTATRLRLILDWLTSNAVMLAQHTPIGLVSAGAGGGGANDGGNNDKRQCDLTDLLADINAAIGEFEYNNNVSVELSLSATYGNEQSGFWNGQIVLGVNAMGQVYSRFSEAPDLQGQGAYAYVSAGISIGKQVGPEVNGLSESSIQAGAFYVGLGDSVELQRSSNGASISIPDVTSSALRRVGISSGAGLGWGWATGQRASGTSLFPGSQRDKPKYSGCGGKY